MSIHVKTEEGKAKCGARPWGMTLGLYFAKEGMQATCRRCLGTTRRRPNAPLTRNYVGKILHCSWGYDMTFNEYARVIAQTAKSVKVVRLSTMTNGGENGYQGTGKAVPGPETGKTFTAINRGSAESPYFAFEGRHWSLWNGSADYENHID